MQPYARLLIVLVLSVFSGWFLLQQFFSITPPETSASAPTTAVSIDHNAMMNMQFKDMNGELQFLKKWQGKVIVLNFWATWCPPCREEMPELSEMQKQYLQKNVVIIGLSTEDFDTTKAFMQSISVSYPILAGDLEAMRLAESMGNNRGILPYTVILDEKGAVVKTFFGRVNQQLLEKTILSLSQVSALKEKQ